MLSEERAPVNAGFPRLLGTHVMHRLIYGFWLQKIVSYRKPLSFCMTTPCTEMFSSHYKKRMEKEVGRKKMSSGWRHRRYCICPADVAGECDQVFIHVNPPAEMLLALLVS